MRERIISIVPLGEVEISVLNYIAGCLGSIFPLDARVMAGDDAPCLLPEEIVGGRCFSSRILHLLSVGMGRTLKLLAVTEADLYSPIFSCLFGEAQLGGDCALISLHRLRQEFYDLPSDQKAFLSRCEKVAIHEIAHTFGLVHCRDKNCVMYPANNIAEVDTKSNSFCAGCARALTVE